MRRDPLAKILIGKYEGTIYPEGNGYTGALELGVGPDGKRNRLKRKGKNKTAVIDKLVKAVEDLEAGIKSPENYTVGQAVEDWISKGLKNRGTTKIRILADKHVIPLIGKGKLKELHADDVDEWLDGLTDKLSIRTLRDVHSILKRSIRQAQARDRVGATWQSWSRHPRADPGDRARPCRSTRPRPYSSKPSHHR